MDANKEIYYTQTDKSGNNKITISAYSNSMFIDIELAEKNSKSLVVNVNKYISNKDNWMPRSDEETLVKIISKDAFDKHYSKLLREIYNLDRSSGEFYYYKSYGKKIDGVAWFSNDKLDKKNILIKLDNQKEDFDLTLTCADSWKNIQHFRRAGNTIERESYNLFFKSLLNFLYDRGNYVINYFDLVDLFNKMLNGDVKEQEMTENIKWQSDNSKLIVAISNRISAIERRLMEIDSDTLEERIKMRGELEGLLFALNIVKAN